MTQTGLQLLPDGDLEFGFVYQRLTCPLLLYQTFGFVAMLAPAFVPQLDDFRVIVEPSERFLKGMPPEAVVLRIIQRREGDQA